MSKYCKFKEKIEGRALEVLAVQALHVPLTESGTCGPSLSVPILIKIIMHASSAIRRAD